MGWDMGCRILISWSSWAFWGCRRVYIEDGHLAVPAREERGPQLAPLQVGQHWVAEIVTSARGDRQHGSPSRPGEDSREQVQKMEEVSMQEESGGLSGVGVLVCSCLSLNHSCW